LARVLAVSLLLLLTAVPVLATTSSSSQPSALDVLEGRHTPGFPAILNITSLADLLSVSSPEVRRALERLLYCDTVKCLEEDEASARILNPLLRNATGVDVAGLRALSDRQLLDMIDNPSIRRLMESLLESLNTTGSTGPYEASSLLGMLESSRSNGSLSPRAYAAALELLRRVLERSGSPQAAVVERRQVDVIREALIEASRSGLLSKLTEKIGWLHAESQKWGSSTGNRKWGSGIRGPAVELGLPSVPPSLLALALLAGLAILVFLGSQRLAALIAGAAAGITRRRGGRLELGGAPLVTRLYWAAVRVAERVSGVRMQASMTHREFLSAVEGRLGPLREPFKALTQAYELNRYAGVASGDLEEEALKHYEEIERGRRGARPRPPPRTPGDPVQS
jgi:hypothetical protein